MSNYIDQFETGGVVYDVYDSGAVRKEQGKGLSTNDFTDADKQKLDGLASQAYVTVAELPTASADTMGAIYLVPSSNPQTQNVKDEYVTLRSGTEGSYTYAWELIGSTAVDVSGKADKVASATSGNFAGLDGNGNLTDSGKKASDFLTQHQDISGKADKDTDAVTGNFAAFDASGNPVDSGKKASDFLTEHQDISGKADKATTLAGYGITDAKIEGGTITLGSNTITPLTSHQDITGKADKVSSPTSGDFAGLDANGNLTDSGSKASDFATAAQGAKADTAVQPEAGKGLFSGNYNDLTNKPTIPDAQVQANWNESDSASKAYIQNKPTIPDAQIQSDWNQSDNTAKDYIKNKPSIPAAQVNSDWNASTGVAQILNKPAIPDAVEANPTVPSGTTPTDLTGLKVGSNYYGIPTPTVDNTPTKNSNNLVKSGGVYGEVHPATASSQPAGGMLPNVLYKLGTLTGSVTIAFATPADNTVENEYKFTFTADSTAPTITWPASITKWAGNALDSGLPDVEADTYYEVSVVDGNGIFNKFE